MSIRRFATGLKTMVAFLFAVATQVSHAGPLTQFIDFSGGPDRPDVGLFTYDATTSTFLNFQVAWRGTVFDLTSAANAPYVGAACPGLASSGATGFALMNKTLCGGLYDRWFADTFGASSTFSFSSQTLALPEENGARITATGPGIPGAFGFESSVGDWSLGAAFEAPSGKPVILPDGTVVFPGGGIYVPGQGLLTINYLINFTGGPDLPDLGVFHYDEATTTFSHFLVEWRGVWFDLTDEANAPYVGAACPGLASSGATGFALMNKTLCGGLYDRWFADTFGASSTFSFSSQTLALPEENGARITATGPGIPGAFGFESSVGDWSLIRIGTADPGQPLPLPSTLSLIVLALSMSGRNLRKAKA